MTRQDYERIAAAISRVRDIGVDERDNATIDVVASYIAVALAADNERFDTARFMAATR